MITMVEPIPAGNAIRLFFAPPAGATVWRLLRRPDTAFTGPTDASAFLVYEGDGTSALDRYGLTNGQTYHYRLYSKVGATWIESTIVQGIPLATYADATDDPMAILRERLEFGLREEVARGRLKHKSNVIPVLLAPPRFEDTTFPIVTLHLQKEAPSERAIGEVLLDDEFDGSQWTESEGWLASVNLLICGWSVNADERAELRRAIRRIIVANLPVLDDAGLLQITIDQSDMEDFNTYSAPVYMTNCSFTCLAPVLVGGEVGTIVEVQTTIN